MTRFKRVCLIMPLAVPLALAGCDNTEEYEAQISTLESDLEAARSELEAARQENEELTAQVEEFQGQAEETEQGAGAPSDQAMETVRSELSAAIDKATQTVERLSALEAEPDAPAEQMEEAVSVLRQDVEQLAQNVQTAASELGIELQAGEQGGAAQDQGEQPAATEQTETEAQAGGEEQETQQSQ